MKVRVHRGRSAEGTSPSRTREAALEGAARVSPETWKVVPAITSQRYIGEGRQARSKGDSHALCTALGADRFAGVGNKIASRAIKEAEVGGVLNIARVAATSLALRVVVEVRRGTSLVRPRTAGCGPVPSEWASEGIIP